jgi:hypothetical protein
MSLAGSHSTFGLVPWPVAPEFKVAGRSAPAFCRAQYLLRVMRNAVWQEIN